MTNNALIVLSSIITGWFYNRSKGNILVAGIIHAEENTYTKLLLNMDWNTYLVLKAVVTLAIILADRMWKKLPPDHPAVYRSPQLATQPGVEPTPTLVSYTLCDDVCTVIYDEKTTSVYAPSVSRR